MLVSLLALAACPTLGVRPDVSLLSMSAKGAMLGLKSSDPRQAIDDVKGIMEGVLLDVGNATEHINDDNKATLNTVIDLIENSIYKSMNSSHDADVAALASAVAAAGACNSNFANRIAPGGDIGKLQTSVGGLQTELNDLQSEVDSKTTAERAEWTKLSNHMAALSEAPSCSALPTVRTKENLHSYFEQSTFAIWYADEQADWQAIEDAYDTSAEALNLATEAYAVGLGKRDTGFCMWRSELLSSCSLFGQCFDEKSSNYLDVVKPAVEANMQTRIEAFRAGETIVAQIKFLLAASDDSTIQDVDTTRYELDFPTLPSQGSCNLEVLDDPSFVPSVVCESVGKGDQN